MAVVSLVSEELSLVPFEVLFSGKVALVPLFPGFSGIVPLFPGFSGVVPLVVGFSGAVPLFTGFSGVVPLFPVFSVATVLFFYSLAVLFTTGLWTKGGTNRSWLNSIVIIPLFEMFLIFKPTGLLAASEVGVGTFFLSSCISLTKSNTNCFTSISGLIIAAFSGEMKGSSMGFSFV